MLLYRNETGANMKRILYTILAAVVVLAGNYFFSNSTFKANVETRRPVTSAIEPSTATPVIVPSPVSTLSNTLDVSTPEPTKVTLGSEDGLWITNVGKLNLKQDGSGEITATLDGYGDLGRQDTLQGTLNGDTATLNSQMFGDLTILFSGKTFKTAQGSRNAFCGIRASESNELPAGCGFSGKWTLAANSFFPGDSVVILKQVAGNVSGDFYDGKGNTFDKLTGQVSWGKGWWLGGKNEKGHTITLIMNSFETGFEYIYDDLYQLKLCAVRDGLNSADLGNFICAPSPSVLDSSNQAPSSSIDPTWKKYTNTQVGFSIQYPSYWQEQTLPDENPGKHNIDLKGPEGEVELIWGTGLGGACPEGYQPLVVAKGSLTACHSQRADGTDLWSLADQSLGNTDFAGFVSTNDTTTKSRELVLQVISSLSFP
jgi:hypothetical protein